MITFPSCDIIRPAPMPKSASESLNPVSLSVTSIVPTITSAAIPIASSPIRTIPRGGRWVTSFGPVSAAASIVIDIGSSRLPVSNASNPSTTCRYTGRTKNVPIRTSCCDISVDRPARRDSIVSSARSSSVSRPSRSRRSSQIPKRPEEEDAADDQDRGRARSRAG